MAVTLLNFSKKLKGKKMNNAKPETQLIKIRPMAKNMLGGVNNSTVYRWIKKEGFPKPIKLSPSCSVWNIAEVQEWIDSRQRGAV
jgi:predicted DNA-binding transcriptional regulator AlpA